MHQSPRPQLDEIWSKWCRPTEGIFIDWIRIAIADKPRSRRSYTMLQKDRNISTMKVWNLLPSFECIVDFLCRSTGQKSYPKDWTNFGEKETARKARPCSWQAEGWRLYRWARTFERFVPNDYPYWLRRILCGGRGTWPTRVERRSILGW